MEGYIADRDERADRAADLARRDEYAREWMNQNGAPEARLPAFDSWLRMELANRLDWRWAGAAKAKRIEQCRIQVDTMILGLWRRGWMLDSEKLARRVTEMLDAVATYQRAGKVGDFWSYFKASVDRYVGLNAEEIQAEAMSAGVAVGAVFQQLLKKHAAKPSIPELVAQRTEETLKEKIARQRQQDRRKQADKSQLQFL